MYPWYILAMSCCFIFDENGMQFESWYENLLHAKLGSCEA